MTIEMRKRTAAGVGVDLPVLRHGPAPEKKKDGCDDPSDADEGIGNMDADFQVRQVGPVSSRLAAIEGRRIQPDALTLTWSKRQRRIF
jgi:hypothetical protein